MPAKAIIPKPLPTRRRCFSSGERIPVAYDQTFAVSLLRSGLVDEHEFRGAQQHLGVTAPDRGLVFDSGAVATAASSAAIPAHAAHHPHAHAGIGTPSASPSASARLRASAQPERPASAASAVSRSRRLRMQLSSPRPPRPPPPCFYTCPSGLSCSCPLRTLSSARNEDNPARFESPLRSARVRRPGYTSCECARDCPAPRLLAWLVLRPPSGRSRCSSGTGAAAEPWW